MKITRMIACSVVAALLLSICISSFSQGVPATPKPMTVQCSAQGTSTQSNRLISVTIRIQDYSTDQERETLVAAFKQGGTEALTAALKKMPKKGLISITGHPEYQLRFVRVMPESTASVRKVRLVTDRPVRPGEDFAGLPRTLDYSLLAVEATLDMTKINKSEGVLLPAIQLVVDKKNNKEVTIEAFQNPWKLFNFYNFKEEK